MNWKIFSIISFLLIIPVLIVWIIDSSDYGDMLIYSRDTKFIETTVYDELFDTQTTETEEVEGFWLGLLPPTDQISFRIILGVVPMGSILFVLGVFGIIINKKKKKKDS